MYICGIDKCWIYSWFGRLLHSAMIFATDGHAHTFLILIVFVKVLRGRQRRH